MPLFEGLNGRLMLQGALRNVVVVYLDVVAQRRFKLCCRPEPCLINDVSDTPIEALDHAIGLWMAQRNQTMLDIELFAQAVEQVGPTRLPALAFGSKSVGELATVIGQ